MKLYCFGESGHSYKVALALTLSGQEWEPVFVDFFNGGSRTAEFRQVNIQGECPVLVDGDRTLTQSGVILSHLSKKTGQFGGKTDEEKDEVLRWILWDNHKFSSAAGMLRFQMNFIPEAKRPAEVIAFSAARLKTALNTLEAHLEGRDWIVGDDITNADFSCCSYLFYPEAFTFERAHYPNIDSWLNRISALPNWKHPYDLMQRAYPAPA